MNPTNEGSEPQYVCNSELKVCRTANESKKLFFRKGRCIFQIILCYSAYFTASDIHLLKVKTYEVATDLIAYTMKWRRRRLEISILK
jgi:hypothetical protein